MNPHLRKVLHSVWKARKATRLLDFNSNVGRGLITIAWIDAYQAVCNHISVKDLSHIMQPHNFSVSDYPERLLRIVNDFEGRALNEAIEAYVAAFNAAEQIRIAQSLGITPTQVTYGQFNALHFEACVKLTRYMHTYTDDLEPADYPLDKIERILTLANLERGQKKHGKS